MNRPSRQGVNSLVGIIGMPENKYTTSPCVVSLPLPPHRRGFAFFLSKNLDAIPVAGDTYGSGD
jgi:hypothetical protein